VNTAKIDATPGPPVRAPKEITVITRNIVPTMRPMARIAGGFCSTRDCSDGGTSRLLASQRMTTVMAANQKIHWRTLFIAASDPVY